MANNDIKFNLTFAVNSAQAKKDLKDLKQELFNLTTTNSRNEKSKFGISQELKDAQTDALKLRQVLEGATTSKGTLDLTNFSKGLQQAGLSADQLARRFNSMGPEGRKAFADLARSVTTAEAPLKRTSKLVDDLKRSLKGALNWQISSNVIQGLIGGFQGALRYAEDLNKSLNNIRIVTGSSTEEMAKFAAEANKSAQALSTTTEKYTNASLIYFQQGLSDKEVRDRTETTIKLANAAGQTAETVASQLTAVWNNFNKAGDQSTDHFADIMTKLGATTASSTAEISAGLEKFAGVADTIGLSFEYATSALATVTATSRESADIVGTAFKTIFARIQSLKLGETLEDNTDLNKYSQALSAVGIQIKDTSGNIKDMDTLLDELGGKWGTLAKDQQLALAQTVAGARQYNQLVTLLDNWDSFQKNLSTANNAEGTLDEQAKIYAESWAAAKDRVTASLEEIYSKLIDDDFLIKMTDALSKFIDIVNSAIDGVGGLKGVISLLGLALTNAFRPEIIKSVENLQYRFSMMTKAGQQRVANDRLSFVNSLRGLAGDLPNTATGTAESRILNTQADLQNKQVRAAERLRQTNREITEQDKAQVRAHMQIVDYYAEEYRERSKQRDLEKENLKKVEESFNKNRDILKEYLNENTGKAYLTNRGNGRRAYASDILAFSVEGNNPNRRTAEEGPVSDQNLRNALDNDVIENYSQLSSSYSVGDALSRGLKQLQENSQQVENPEEGLKHFKDSLAALREELKTNNIDISSFEDELQALGDVDSFETLENGLKDFDKKLESVQKNVQDYGENLKNVFKEAGEAAQLDLRRLERAKDIILQGDVDSLNRDALKNYGIDEDTINTLMSSAPSREDVIPEEYDNDFDAYEAAWEARFQEAIDNAISTLDEQVSVYQSFIEATQNASQNIIEVAEHSSGEGNTAIQQAASGISFEEAAEGVEEVYEELEVPERSFTSIALNLSQVVMGVEALASSLTSFFDVLASGQEPSEIFIGLLSSIGGAVLSAMMVLPSMSESVIGLAEGFGLVTAESATLSASLAALAPYAAIITAIGVAIWGVCKAYEHFRAVGESTAEELSEAAKGLQEDYEKTKQEVENLKSSLEEYSEIKSTLEGLTKGTAEWNEQVTLLNDKVLELLENFPELAQYLTLTSDGYYKLDKEGVEQYQLEQNKKIKAAQNIAISANVDADRATQEEERQREIDEYLKDDERIYKLASQMGLVATEDDKGLKRVIKKIQEPGTLYTLKNKVLPEIQEKGVDILNAKDSSNPIHGYSMEGKVRSNISLLEDFLKEGEKYADVKNRASLGEDKSNAELQILGQNLLEDSNIIPEDQKESYGNTLATLISREYDKKREENKSKVSNYNASQLEEAYLKILREQNPSDSIMLEDGKIYKNGEQLEEYDEAKAKETVASDITLKKSSDSETIAKDTLNKYIDILEGRDLTATDTLTSFLAANKREQRAQVTSLDRQEVEKLYKADEEGNAGPLSYSALLTYNKELTRVKGEQLASTKEIFSADSATAEKLNVEQIEAISNALNRANVLESIEGIKFFQEGLKGSETEVENFANAIKNVDWDSETVDSFKQHMNEFGVTTNLTDGEIQALIKSMQLQKQTVEGLAETYSSTHKIIDSLNTGDTIEQEEYDQLYSQLGEEIEDFFMYAADGTRMLIGDAEEFYNLVQTNLLDEQYQKSQDIEKSKESLRYAAQNNVDITRSAGTEEWNKAGKLTKFTIDNSALDAQFAALESYKGYTEDVLIQEQKWKDALADENLSFTKKKDILGEIAEEVHQAVGDNYDLTEATKTLSEEQIKLQEGIASTASSYRELNDLTEKYELSKSVYDEQHSNLFQQERMNDIEEEELESYTDYIMELAESEDYAKMSGFELSESLSKDRESAKNLALQTLRLDEGVESLNKNWKDWVKTLTDSKVGTSDDAEAVTGLRKSLANLLDVSSDYLDLDFLMSLTQQKDAMAEVEKAAAGDADAIEALRDRALEPIVMNIVTTWKGQEAGDDDKKAAFEKVKETRDYLQKRLDSMGDIKAGDVVVSDESIGFTSRQIMDNLKDLARNAELSKDEINSILGDMGYEATFADEPQETYIETPPEYETIMDVVPAGTKKISMGLPPVAAGAMEDPFGAATTTPTLIPQAQNVQTYKITSRTRVTKPAGREKVTTDVGAMATYGKGEPKEIPQINGIKYAPKAAAAPSASPVSGSGSSSSPGSHGGNGTGGSTAQPSKQPHAQVQRDRYYRVNNALKDNTTLLDKNRAAQDKLAISESKLFGEDKIKNLREQNKLLRERNSIIKDQQTIDMTKRDMLQQELKEKMGSMKKAGAEFDSNGNLTNYQQFMQKIEDEYNAAVDRYNNMSKDEQDSEAGKKLLEDAEKIKSQRENQVSRYQAIRYDELPNIRKEIADIEKEIAENIIKEIENNKEIRDAKLQLKLDSREIKKDWRDFLLEAQRDYNKLFRDSLISDTSNIMKFQLKPEKGIYQKNLNDYAGEISEAIKEYAILKTAEDKGLSTSEMESLVKDYSLSYSASSEATEKIKETWEQVLSIGNDVLELEEQAYNNLIDALSEAESLFSFVDEALDNINSKLEYEKQVIELLYGDNAFDKFTNYYDNSLKLIDKQIEAAKKQRDFWKKQFAESSGSISDFTKWSTETQQAYKNMLEAEDTVRDLTLNRLTTLRDFFKNDLAGIIDSFERTVWNGSSYEEMKSNWETTQKLSSIFLENVDKAYQIQSLSNKIQQSISTTEGLKNQQKLEKLRQNELKALTEKNNLSQKDVDLAEARYQIALKEIALEEAQKSKNTMKLVRDSNGNWTYQYVADVDDITSKEQDLLEAKYEYRKLAQEAYKENINSYGDIYSEMSEKINELFDSGLTVEAFGNSLQEIYSKYTPYLISLGEQIREYEQENSVGGYGVLEEAFKQDNIHWEYFTDEQREAIEEIRKNSPSDFESIRNYILSQGINLTDVFEEYMPNIEAEFKNLFASVTEKYAELIDSQGLDQIYSDAIVNTESSVKSIEKLLDDTNSGSAISKVTDKIDELREEYKVVQEYSKKITQQVEKIYEYLSNNEKGRSFLSKQTNISALKASVIAEQLSTDASLSGFTEVNMAEIIKSVFGEKANKLVEQITQAVATAGQAIADTADYWKYQKKSESQNEINNNESSFFKFTKKNAGSVSTSSLGNLENVISSELKAAKVESFNDTAIKDVLSTLMATVVDSSGTSVFNITAEFPAANDVTTIQNAILSLPNLASQYVNTDR